jgi:GNAT superfamily N-acetyltransferase
MTETYRHRLAKRDDAPALAALMREAIDAHLAAFLAPEQVAASHEIMGLDTQLIEDGGYFVLVDETGAIVAGGGWSDRATLYGGDHSEGRSDRRLDPATEPARIRAMYVAAGAARRGLGRRILGLCEEAARAAGFRRAELVATAAGRPLYEACGYRVDQDFAKTTRAGVAVPLARMSKRL